MHTANLCEHALMLVRGTEQRPVGSKQLVVLLRVGNACDGRPQRLRVRWADRQLSFDVHLARFMRKV